MRIILKLQLLNFALVKQGKIGDENLLVFFFTHGREDGGQILKQAQASSLKIVPKLVYLFLIQILFV